MNTICTYEGCGAAIENPSPNSKYCPDHSKAVRDANVEKAKRRYAEKERKCETCETIITGNNHFCDECKHKRQLAAQKKHYDETKIYYGEKPKYTSTEFLKKFTPEIVGTNQNGDSYGKRNAVPVMVRRNE